MEDKEIERIIEDVLKEKEQKQERERERIREIRKNVRMEIEEETKMKKENENLLNNVYGGMNVVYSNVNKVWKNSEKNSLYSFIKGSVVSTSILLTGLLLTPILQNHFHPKITNETYEQATNLHERIMTLENKLYHDISSSTEPYDITADFVNHIATLNTKKENLTNLINTPEYQTVIKAQEDREIFTRNYLSGVILLSALSFAGGTYAASKINKNLDDDQ